MFSFIKKIIKYGLIGFCALFVLMLVIVIITDEDNDTTSPVRETARVERPVEKPVGKKEVSKDEKIKRQFSSWDGSHRLLVKMVKNVMNDPDSFDHDTTRYRVLPNDEGIQVSMIYRGKNAFGGVVRNTITAQFSLDGKFIREVK